ncbi:hypothetical protein [Photobacterium leiognathi]|uniref:hypothetical protein n=1 Tax=Photobacterium leiognathi TaxID=553611 RepID=UPI00298186BE|nr:hypothetical protein [Photobacterium leiognathi]
MQSIHIHDYQAINELSEELFQIGNDSEQLIEHLNAKIKHLLFNTKLGDENIFDLIERYQSRKNQLVEEVSEQTYCMNDYYESRSERWLKGDNGERYGDWRDCWTEYQDRLATVEFKLSVFNFLDGKEQSFGLDIATPELLDLPVRAFSQL